ncbi:MAG: TatD family hydrolase [Candidatus Pacebacteria bacterium]|nr:TatD family hydrolase [Candidatus Paceibacterota bacterium]
MSRYIDIHAHTNFVVFDQDRDAVIRRALDNDTWVINIGTQYDTSKKAVEMTNEYKEGVYACVGLHPIHTSVSYHDESELGENGKDFTSRGEIFDKEKYRELAKKGRVVGIGECGLDYYHMEPESIEKQRKAFISQIELANELNLPLMLHIRNSDERLDTNAYQDALSLLKEYAKVKGMVHFFAGTLEDANDFIDFGFYISFAGVITYPPKKNDKRPVNYEKIIKGIPLDRIMADTDSPYVAPVPNRGRRNEPAYIRDIVKKIALIKGLEEKETTLAIRGNIKKLFDI